MKTSPFWVFAVLVAALLLVAVFTDGREKNIEVNQQVAVDDLRFQPISPPENEEKKYRAVRMNVSAYCGCSLCCGEYADGFTASGKPVSYNNGRFVAAPKNYPFGTKMKIPGYSDEWVEVQDRGGAIKGNKLDVFFSRHEDALEWGRQYLDVEVEE